MQGGNLNRKKLVPFLHEILAINKTHDRLRVSVLKMCFRLESCVRKLFF